MHTETNLWEGPHGDEAVKWLWKEWANVLRLRNVGIPTVGFTWYSLTDQVDWDTALREQNGNVNPLGLFDLDRRIRNVGRAYKQLIADWRNVLPASSVCLVVPIKKLSEHPDELSVVHDRKSSNLMLRHQFHRLVERIVTVLSERTHRLSENLQIWGVS